MVDRDEVKSKSQKKNNYGQFGIKLNSQLTLYKWYVNGFVKCDLRNR